MKWKYRLLTLLMMAALCVALLTAGAFADGNVPIDDTTFPNKSFRNWVSQNCDTNHNGSLSPAEIAAVTSLDIEGRGVTDLSGIRYFTSLETLNNKNGSLHSLDVSGMTSLRTVDCSYCMDGWGPCLNSVNVKGCTSLETLNVSFHSIDSLDVSGCTSLRVLDCSNNTSAGAMKILNVTGCTSLEALNCSHNKLTSLNLSGLQNLQTLNCAYNVISTLDSSSCIALKTLECHHNNLSTLEVSGCKSLQMLYCAGNTNLVSVDVSECPLLVQDPSGVKAGANTKVIYNNIGAIKTVTATAAAGKTTVRWSASENAELYILQRRIKDETAWATLNSKITGMAYEDTTGVGGTVYQYRVRGRRGTDYGDFQFSSVVRAIASTSTPSAISSATATAYPGKIIVAWSKSNNAAAYILQRRIKDDTTWKTLKSNITALYFEDTTGEAGTVYQYRVRGRNGTTYGLFKLTSVVRAVATQTPGAIGGVKVTTTSGINTVTWTPSGGATMYQLQRQTGSGAWETLSSAYKSTTFKDANIKKGINYRYRVRGRNSAGYGVFKVGSYVVAK